MLKLATHSALGKCSNTNNKPLSSWNNFSSQASGDIFSACLASTWIKARPNSRISQLSFVWAFSLGKQGKEEYETPEQMLNLVQSPTELGTATPACQLFETQRLAGSTGKGDHKQLWRDLGEDGWAGTPQAQGNAASSLMWEFRKLARSAAARQLPRAQPQQQKYVHMVSICLSGETLILSCHLLAAKPELPRPARSALPDPWPRSCLGQLRLKDVFRSGPQQTWYCFSSEPQSQRSVPEGHFVTGCTMSFTVQLPWHRLWSHWDAWTPKSRNSPCKFGPWLWSQLRFWASVAALFAGHKRTQALFWTLLRLTLPNVYWNIQADSCLQAAVQCEVSARVKNQAILFTGFKFNWKMWHFIFKWASAF